jgi:hypothetical protein
MKAYSGGYVLVTEPTTLTFPTTLTRQTSSGRKKTIVASESQSGWFVPLTLTQGGEKNTHSGIGMLPDATTGNDRYDLITPRFMRYFDLLEDNEHNHIPAARQIVDERDHYTWNYKLEQNGNQLVVISWPLDSLQEVPGQLLLYDHRSGVIVNMKSVGEYPVNATSTRISFHFDRNGAHANDVMHLGKAYPNPFQSIVTIPYVVASDDAYFANVTLTISDINGHKVFEKNVPELGTGVKEQTWDGTNFQGEPVSSGLYLFKLTVVSDDLPMILTGKIIKK